MIFRTRAIAAVLLAVVSTSTSHAANTALEYVVQKNGGERATYSFLPVQYDPDQAARVAEDMRRATPQLTAPPRYQISTSNLPEVRDQGRRSSCAYFATIGLTESYFLRKTPRRTIDLSEECLVDVRNWMFAQGSNYRGADRPGQRPDPGGDLPDSIIRTIERNGIPLESGYSNLDCRYNGASNGAEIPLSTYNSIFSSGQSVAYGKGMSFDQNSMPTIDKIKQLISQNVPVEVGIIIYRAYLANSDWRYSARNRESTIVGGHAIMLTGYRTVGSSTIFTFKNSWGTNWGSQGYGTLDDKILTKSWDHSRSLYFAVSLHD